MVDSTWLTVSKAAKLLGGIHPETVRRYAAADFLYMERLPRGHRRIDPASVQALNDANALPEGDERDEAIATLREKNRLRAERRGRKP